ncbi:MAG: histidinol-phosphatase HisJ family protein [Syntrophomonadaceae bacterium]|jgi:histidinol-phosphatase (PHP family)
MHFFADYHTHTAYSGDSEAPMQDMVERAVQMNLKQLVFTDHVDYDYADPNFEQIDFETYLQEFTALKKKYHRQIELLMGVEVGFQHHVADRIKTLLQSYPFEFVICSTHMADKLDFYTGAFFEGKDCHAAYERYFQNVLAGIKELDDFDVYGHLDFIVRYGNYPQKELHYRDYSDILDEILRRLIYMGKGIEINTSGYRYGLQQLHPQLEILKRYRQLGGEIITVGSDAHFPMDICFEFQQAYETLRWLGYKYLAAYKKRKVEFIKIP